MPKTILITGASSGIGRAIVEYFSSKGWNVAATMRKPEDGQDLVSLPNTKLYALDVTDEHSIKTALDTVISDFKCIDVLVNNAGYGAVGIFEKATKDQIQKQFDVNVFGVMNMIRAILSHFREQKGGMIINITSMGGLVTFPIYSVYHATKWAVEGFAESLQFELRPFNIIVKNIEPGVIKTDFYSRSQDVFNNEAVEGYNEYEKTVIENTLQEAKNAPGPEAVARVVYKAATDNSSKLRYPAGNQAPWILFLRKILPYRLFIAGIRFVLERG